MKQQGADIEVVKPVNGRTALMATVKDGHLEAAKTLLEGGARTTKKLLEAKDKVCGVLKICRMSIYFQ